ncbi:MAG: tetratricopeptide repeat protein [Bacteroidales bacterium]|nr:tetratricopeptide repeat protein [Bacteroidales bacterium]MCF8402970.1 tetratricopeptide repeat protein [Bacteroidales bacterium]
METKIIKWITIICVTFIFIMQGVSQDYKSLQSAFSESYYNESMGDYTKSILNLKNVYQEDSYEINLRLGWLNYMAGFFTESASYYQKAMELKPMSIEAKFGYIYPTSASGNWEVVKKQYFDILKIDPKNSLATYRLGSIYYGNEDYSTALKYFEALVNLYPFDYDGLLMFGWTSLKLGKFREAEVIFNKVLLNRPNDKSALEGLKEIK